MTERRVEIVYCDDIRNEVGNKVSLIGVYNADLLVERLPTTLAKLCAWINVITPTSQPFERLRVRLLQEDRELVDTGDIFSEASPMPATRNDDSSLLGVNLAFVLSPFQIDNPTWLRVVAETEDGDLSSRKLRIVQGEAP